MCIGDSEATVGDAVGDWDGDREGDSVGDDDGKREGDAVGLVDGKREGDAVGALEGNRVGASVGAAVGSSVGASVGAQRMRYRLDAAFPRTSNVAAPGGAAVSPCARATPVSASARLSAFLPRWPDLNFLR
mgnify:CR=1 FL=1